MSEIEKEHAEAWQRCIRDAGGSRGVAQQAVTLAALNGLFDLHRDASLMGVQRPEDVADQEYRELDWAYCLACIQNERLRAVTVKLRTALDALRPFPLVVEPVAAALIAEGDAVLALPHTGQRAENTGHYATPEEIAAYKPLIDAPQAGYAKEGWQLVPCTTADGRLVEMWEAGNNAIEYITLAEYQQRLPDLIKKHGPGCRFPLYVDMPKVYAALLSAAPPPPVAESGWREIETAPKGERIQLYNELWEDTYGAVQIGVRMDDAADIKWLFDSDMNIISPDAGWTDDDLTPEDYEPTYWRPLPATPPPTRAEALCRGGLRQTSEPCVKCGATEDDDCGAPLVAEKQTGAG